MSSSGSGCAPVTGFGEGGNELQETSGLVEQLLACEERLCSVELFTVQFNTCKQAELQLVTNVLLTSIKL
jgi:hypothetical protein